MKKLSRILSLLMAAVMLASSAMPVYAFEDFGSLEDLSGYEEGNLFDTPEEAPPLWDNEEDSLTWEDTFGEENSDKNSSDFEKAPSESDIQQPEQTPENTPAETEGETVPKEGDAPLPDEPVTGTSGLDPPDVFTFEMVRSGSGTSSGMRKARANPGSITVYIQKITGLSHAYPFNGGSPYNAYTMFTSDGKAVYCVEPARFNTTNGSVSTGSLDYNGLSDTQKKEIAKAASCCTTVGNADKYYAAQAIIWEICLNQSPRSGSVYSAVIAANSGRLGGYYEQIRSEMESLGEIPSFMSKDPQNPTIHEMTDNGGSWSIDLENTNSNVTLKAEDFQTRAPFQFNVSGNTLTVDSPSEPDEDSFVEWHKGGEGCGLIFWASSQQEKATYDETQGIPADGYMAFTQNFIPPKEDPAPETPEPSLGYLTIVKYDGDTNLPLGGAVFKVECEGYVNEAVDIPYGGKTIVIPIPEGETSVDVTVTEVTAPSGYVKDSEPKTVTVTANDTINIVEVGFVNYPEACSLEVYKHETGNKGVALEGASFRIRYADPNVSAQTWTETTDGSGKIHIDLPAAGALIVEELSAPAGYSMNAKNTYDVTVMRGEQKVLDVPNDKRAQLIVIKKDAQTGQTLAGAIIKITLLRAHTPPYEQNISYTQTTGADGRTVFSGLIPGEYRVEEQSPPQYYLPTDVVHNVSVFEGTTEAVEVVFENEPWSGLTIKKVDSTNDKGLQGAVFKVYKGSHEDPLAFIGDFETNENGVVVVPKLESGQYYTIVEAQPPYGYLLSENNVQTVMVRPDAVQNNVTVIFQNKPKPKLLIEKIDEVTGKKLEGAVFRVSLKDSAEYKEFTTGADGTVLIENLEEDWYTVQEIRSPTNYILDDQIRNIQTKAGETTILRINNHRKPNLTIRKVDEQTGNGIAGVTLRITKEGAKEYQDVTTGADGVFVLEHADPGWYIVTEQRTPETHILDQTPHYIEVKADQDTEIVIKNKAKPSLRILKTDSVTKQPMQGVTFEVSVKQGKTLGEYRTDAGGEIFLPNIEPQLYVIREIRTLDGYLIDTQQKEALVEWGKTTEVAFTNTPKNPLLIYKVDFHTGEPLAGATFLVEKVNGEHVGEYITGRNGYATVTGIEPGFYLVKEVKPPLNYILDETPKTVELKYDSPAIVQFEDKAMSGLHIKKIDSLTKEPMEGVSFRVSEKAGRTIGEFKTDAQGSILVDNLQPGWYTVREIDTLEGYILDELPRDVEFVWGQLTTLEFTNDRKAQLQVKKVDTDTGEPLAGAKFRLETVGGEFLGEYSTDRTGFFTVDNLNVDYVVVREIKEPDGYLLNNVPYTVRIEANKPAILEVSNKRLSPIQIRKVDAETGAPLAGAHFRVTQANGEYVGDFSTGTDGFLNIPELQPGFYIVSETQAPAGYLLDQTPQTIEVKANIPALVEFTNKRLPGLQVRKIDGTTKQPLGGAKFRVEKGDGRQVGDFVTNSAGFFVLSDLEAGAYTVYETEAPAGYILDKSPQTAVLKPNDTTTLEFADKPLAGLQIKKVDAVTGQPMKGVEFRIAKLNNEAVGTYVTDGAGLIFVPDLKEGWYVVTETRTLEGYMPDSAPRNVKVLSDKLNVVEYKNYPYPHLQIEKIDAETRQPLEGVRFKVSDRMGRELGSYTTNKQGQIHLTGMEQGIYFVQETETLDGYVLDKSVHEVNLLWGKTTRLEIPNTPLGRLRIRKIDSETRQPLAGAEFHLFNSKGELVGEYVTDALGIIHLPKELEEGRYTLKEVKAPDGYVLNDAPRNIEIKADETLELEIPNTSLGTLRIKKIDSETKEPLYGAEFHLYDSKGNLLGEYSTDNNGIIELTRKLTAGKYLLKETKTPDGYVRDEMSKTIEIKEGETLNVEIPNIPLSTLRIRKIDSKTQKPLIGALFRLYNQTGKLLGEYTTDDRGIVEFPRQLAAGKYVLKEIQAPEGYVLDDVSKTIELEAGKTLELEVPNVPLSSLRIRKVDSGTKEPLPGAVFRLFDSKNKPVGDYTTDELGVVEITQKLTVGRYQLKEITAPAGYSLLSKPLTIEIPEGETLEIEVPNTPLGTLQIRKIDQETKAPLSGAVFQLFDGKKNPLGSYTTDSSGLIEIPRTLAAGKYWLKETKAPAGYALDAEPKAVEIRDGETIIVEFANIPLCGLKIRKVDSETKAPLYGAEFHLYNENGTLLGEYTTDDNGQFELSRKLTTGMYILKETKAPEGYVLNSHPQKIELKAGETLELEVPNVPLNTLRIRKIDSKTQQPLMGAVFRLYQGGKLFGEYTTDDRGIIELPRQLAAGKYTLKEIQAPEGYVLNSDPRTIELEPGKTVELEIPNVPLSGLKIKKIDSETREALTGAVFRLSDSRDKVIGDYTTNEFGIIEISRQLLAGKYILRELTAPEGYALLGKPLEIEIPEGDTLELEIPNTPLGTLKVQKVDRETKKPLSGAVFQLYDEKGNPLGSSTTNAAGEITIARKLAAGKYWLKETKAPTGYTLDSTPKAIEIKDGETTRVEITNIPLCTLKIQKVDSETGEPLKDAGFLLYDAKKNLLGEFTTDKDGKIELYRKLTAGKYTLKEIKAPDGYVLPEEPLEIELKSGETLELEIPNKPMRGKIQITKKAANDNPITKAKAGALLEGARFEIYNDKLELVDTITTDEKGVAISKELPMGTYGIQEVKAPEYYLLDGKVFYAELKLDGDLVRFEVQNQSVDVDVTIEKRGNVEVMAGDIMAYDFSEIRNASNVSLNEFYWHDQLPTDAVRLGQIVTGTWSERLTYSVAYRTNQRSRYRTLASNLSSKTAHTLDCGRETLNLAANEYVTDIRFEFGIVEPGFHEETKPVFYVTTLADLEDGYRIINRTDVGGKVGEEWIVAKDTWVTVVWGRPKGKLPNTGMNE